MKKHIIYFAAAVGLLFTACNDDYMDRYPIEKPIEATAFKTYENFKTYSWGLYETFHDKDNYTRGINADNGNYDGDRLAGWLMWNTTTDGNRYRTASMLTPTATGSGGWNFNFIRRVNLMLGNIDQSVMTDAEKEHWRSVGYFFRAYRYFELLARFGDLPWVDKVLQENDPDVLGARLPREQVAAHILADLQYAETHIKVAGDGANTINQNVVRALMSRFCLFEGTWAKYHGTGGDATKYLDECVRVSQALAASFPTVDPAWDNLLNSDDLSKYKGIILYKLYATDLMSNNATRYERSEMGNTEMPKSTVELYLSANGLPITNANNTTYAGDRTMNDEFRNRDKRLWLTVVPPFCLRTEVEKKGTPTFKEAQPKVYNFQGYYKNSAVDNEEFVKEIDNLRLAGLTGKRLPLYNWSAIRLAIYSPHLAGTGESQMITRTGYYLWRQVNYWDNTVSGSGTVDRPIFWIEEALLNWAEASFERNGSLSQTVADQTINKLRLRAGVVGMDVANIGADFDPARDPLVDPVLWEIRRERMVELMGMGFGLYDIRRWKKAEYFINRSQIGAYLDRTQWIALNKNTGAEIARPKPWNLFDLVDKDFTPSADKNRGYLKRYDNPIKGGQGWSDKFYLFPIPMNDLLLNPKLVQNPGWDTPAQ